MQRWLVFFRIEKNEHKADAHLAVPGTQNREPRRGVHLVNTEPRGEQRAESHSSPQGILIFLRANVFKMHHHQVRIASARSISNSIRFRGDEAIVLQKYKSEREREEGDSLRVLPKKIF